MVRRLLRRLRRWLVGSETVDSETDDDRFEGSGDPIAEPAYNSNWEAHRSMRRVQEQADAAEEQGHVPEDR